MRPKPQRRFPPEVLSPEEVGRLLEACGNDHWRATRDRALLAVLYCSGLRIGEALALRPKDLDLRNGSIRVLWAKGGSSRTVGIDGQAGVMVAAWLEVWVARAATPNSPMKPTSTLFCTRTGTPLTKAYIRRLLPLLARRAGILKRVHAHGVRHTHAAELRSEGVDIGIISKQLGHRSITTTARYLDHIAPWAFVDAVRARAWAWGVASESTTLCG
jgi:site-specific recombinase XerD